MDTSQPAEHGEKGKGKAVETDTFNFNDLPEDMKRLVIDDYADLRPRFMDTRLVQGFAPCRLSQVPDIRNLYLSVSKTIPPTETDMWDEKQQIPKLNPRWLSEKDCLLISVWDVLGNGPPLAFQQPDQIKHLGILFNPEDLAEDPIGFEWRNVLGDLKHIQNVYLVVDLGDQRWSADNCDKHRWMVGVKDGYIGRLDAKDYNFEVDFRGRAHGYPDRAVIGRLVQPDAGNADITTDFIEQEWPLPSRWRQAISDCQRWIETHSETAWETTGAREKPILVETRMLCSENLLDKLRTRVKLTNPRWQEDSL